MKHHSFVFWGFKEPEVLKPIFNSLPSNSHVFIQRDILSQDPHLNNEMFTLIELWQDKFQRFRQIEAPFNKIQTLNEVIKYSHASILIINLWEALIHEKFLEDLSELKKILGEAHFVLGIMPSTFYFSKEKIKGLTACHFLKKTHTFFKQTDELFNELYFGLKNMTVLCHPPLKSYAPSLCVPSSKIPKIPYYMNSYAQSYIPEEVLGEHVARVMMGVIKEEKNPPMIERLSSLDWEDSPLSHDNKILKMFFQWIEFSGFAPKLKKGLKSNSYLWIFVLSLLAYYEKEEKEKLKNFQNSLLGLSPRLETMDEADLKGTILLGQEA
jgi:hypothetical protein